jgi:hypothetical protein
MYMMFSMLDNATFFIVAIVIHLDVAIPKTCVLVESTSLRCVVIWTDVLSYFYVTFDVLSTKMCKWPSDDLCLLLWDRLFFGAQRKSVFALLPRNEIHSNGSFYKYILFNKIIMTY